MMSKICINGRDELLMLDLSQVACFKANEDYTTIYYVSGMTASISMGLNKVESFIAVVPKSSMCDFVRVGRSYIVNQGYLYQINVLRQKMTLSDGQRLLTLSVPKEALKRYKQYISDRHSSINPDVSSKID